MKHNRLTTGSSLAVLSPLTGIAAWLPVTLGLCATVVNAQTVTQIIDVDGDGANMLINPQGIALDGASNVYVTGNTSGNAFRIFPGFIKEIIDQSGDGVSNTFGGAVGIAVDTDSNAYVAGLASDNAFRISPGGAITQIIDSSGDGAGNILNGSGGIAVDAGGNVYVTGSLGSNAFKITPLGAVTQIIDVNGAGAGTFLSRPAPSPWTVRATST